MVNKYYRKNKEKLPKKACERYQNLSEEDKEKKRQYNRVRNKNLSEEEKEKKVGYIRNYYLAHKKIFRVDLWIYVILRQLKKNTLNFLVRYSGNYFVIIPYKNFFIFLFYKLFLEI